MPFSSDSITSPMHVESLWTEETKAAQPALRFSLAWTHKSGRTKQQQFWVYCEDKQYNYCQVSLLTADGAAGDSSRFAVVPQLEGHYVFIQDYDASRMQQTCTVLSTSCKIQLPTSSLSLIDPNELEMHMKLIDDVDLPLYHNQGSASRINILEQGVVRQHPKVPFPYSFQYQWVFRKRQKGWFRVKTIMSFRGQPLVDGVSEIFMFNDPRMTTKKKLKGYTSQEIKLMQCYSASQVDPSAKVVKNQYYTTPSVIDAHYAAYDWERLAEAQGISRVRLIHLLDKSYEAFPKSPGRKGRRSSAPPTPLQPAGSSSPAPAREMPKSALGQEVAMTSPVPEPLPPVVETDGDVLMGEMDDAFMDAALAQYPFLADATHPGGSMVDELFPFGLEPPRYGDEDFQSLLNGREVQLDEDMVAWLMPEVLQSGSSSEVSPRTPEL